MGRPTTYTVEMLEKAQKYFEPETLEERDELVPTAVGLALYLGVATSTIYKWAETHDEFSDTLANCKQLQYKSLVNGGLGSKYNAAITKLMLANHGLTEKAEITGKDGAPLVPEVSDQELSRRICFILSEAEKNA